MYHYNLKISLFALNAQQCAWIQEVEPLRGFTHTYAIDPPVTADNIAASDIIL